MPNNTWEEVKQIKARFRREKQVPGSGIEGVGIREDGPGNYYLLVHLSSLFYLCTIPDEYEGVAVRTHLIGAIAASTSATPEEQDKREEKPQQGKPDKQDQGKQDRKRPDKLRPTDIVL